MNITLRVFLFMVHLENAIWQIFLQILGKKLYIVIQKVLKWLQNTIQNLWFFTQMKEFLVK